MCGRPEKERLVLLHGWGMSRSVWDGVAGELGGHYAIDAIDLPGHGDTPAPDTPPDIDAAARGVLARTSGAATWMAWSLGGLVAIAAASIAPERVKALVLVCASPCFVGRQGWPHALRREDFDDLRARALEDAPRALQRYLAWQGGGGNDARKVVHALQGGLRASPPDWSTLPAWLQVLGEADERGRFAALACRVLCILGENDPVVPSGVGNDLARLNPHAQAIVLPGAAHAPPVSHPRELARLAGEFVHGH